LECVYLRTKGSSARLLQLGRLRSRLLLHAATLARPMHRPA
jgi:hypothetical protein